MVAVRRRNACRRAEKGHSEHRTRILTVPGFKNIMIQAGPSSWDRRDDVKGNRDSNRLQAIQLGFVPENATTRPIRHQHLAIGDLERLLQDRVGPISRWDCTLEPVDDDKFAVRLGFRQVRGMSNKDGAEIVAARADRPFESVDDLWRRADVPVASLVQLAEADAMKESLGLARREALWALKALRGEP